MSNLLRFPGEGDLSGNDEGGFGLGMEVLDERIDIGVEVLKVIFSNDLIVKEIEEKLFGFVYTIDEIRKVLNRISLKFGLEFEEEKDVFAVMPEDDATKIIVFDDIDEETRNWGVKIDSNRNTICLFELA